ncbi:MAG: hypothetical protein SOZ58_06215 [Prevotella sp.]|nr:hypothetical protein [Prevotella sp.]
MLEGQENIIKEFDLYLEKIKQIGRKARVNYISWSKYLAKKYDLASVSTEEEVEAILEKERQLASKRAVYKTKHDIGNFKATLRRFLPFNQSRICKLHKLKPSMAFDEMIDLIAMQDTAAHAIIMNEAIRLMLFEANVTLSDEQKTRLKKSMEKFQSAGNTYFQNFGTNSNDVVINS